MLREDHPCFDCKNNAADELCMFTISDGQRIDLCEGRCKYRGICLYWNPRRRPLKEIRRERDG